MTQTSVIFIQARMESSRYPGKMLAPFRGQPLIWNVIERVRKASVTMPLVVLTSTNPADDPLALYVNSLGVEVFRGPMANVLQRFQEALNVHPANWVFRISGDSPYFDASLLAQYLTYIEQQPDLVTNVFPRTFPKGHSLELIRVQTLQQIRIQHTSSEEQEHVTLAFYNSPEKYHIINVESQQQSEQPVDLTVDTLDDLRRLQAIEAP